jgi:uncharacterized damage-inducible protein DinB
MLFAETILAEFEAQHPVTRKFLERLPENRLTWKPHERSMTAGQLAFHIASVPGGVVRLVQQGSAPAPDFSAMMKQPSSVREILDTHDNSAIAVRSILPQFDDAAVQEHCRLLQGETEILAVPRTWFLRDVMLNHVYQHRGQFSVYLRMLNVPVPASWGPSADELPEFLQQAQAHAAA